MPVNDEQKMEDVLDSLRNKSDKEILEIGERYNILEKKEEKKEEKDNRIIFFREFSFMLMNDLSEILSKNGWSLKSFEYNTDDNDVNYPAWRWEFNPPEYSSDMIFIKRDSSVFNDYEERVEHLVCLDVRVCDYKACVKKILGSEYKIEGAKEIILFEREYGENFFSSVTLSDSLRCDICNVVEEKTKE